MKTTFLQSANSKIRYLALLMVFTLITTNAWGTEEVIYTLNTSTTGGTNGYAKLSEDIEITNHEKTIRWNARGNTTVSPWRIGGQSINNVVREVYSETAISDNVTKVIVTHGGTFNLTSASVTLNVYSTAAAAAAGGTTNRISSVSGGSVAANNVITFNRPDGHDWTGRYYRFEYTCKYTDSSNKYLQLSTADFYADISSCTKIAAPTVTATPGNGRIDLSWSNQTGASSYTVTKTPSGGSVGTPSKSGSTWSCAITGLTNGTTYTWSVEAVGSGDYCASGNTAASASATPNAYRTITYYDKDGQHTTSLADGTNIADALNALYGVGGPTSCDATNYEYFVGWKDGSISGTASSVTLLDDEVVNSTNAAKTFYAVWSDTDPSAGGSELFSWEGSSDNGSTSLTNMSGVTANGLGSDYAASNAPYRVKLDNTGDNIIITVASPPTSVALNIKMLGGRSTSSITVQESTATNGTFTDVETLSIEGSQDNVLELETSNSFAATTRAIKLYFTKGSNVGLGGITVNGSSGTANYITTCCTPLGAINGSVNLTSDGCSAGQLKATWKMSAITGIASQTLKVYKQSDDTEVTGLTGLTGITASTSNQTITISGLQPCTGYYVKVFNVSSGGSYCEGGEVATSGNATTLGYTYTVNLSNASKSSGTVSANTCSGNINAVYAALSGYHLPTSITVTNAGAQGTGWTWNSSTGALTVNAASVTGNVVVTITAEANSCSSYSFHYGTDGQSDWAINCFDYSGNADRQWILNATIANKSHYYVGKQGSFYNNNLGNSNAKSYTNQMQYMQLALDRSHGSNNQLGSNYAGVQGTILCYDNSNSDNLYVDFLPAGYYFILDAAGTPTALPMTCTNADMTAANILSANSVWETEIQTVTDVSKKYTVGIKADAAIAGKAWQTTRYNTNENMTTLKKRSSASSFGSNLAAADVTAGLRGKYRIWADNFSTTSGEKNWYAHFVPYHRVVFKANYPANATGEPADTYAGETSVEASSGSIALASAPTAPTGYTFDGWYDAASGGNKITTARTIAAGATADIVLYAHWTANTISITLSKNNSDASGSTNGSASILFDASAVKASPAMTAATRTGYTVEGYYSDAACTAANKVLDASGNVINSTVSGYTTSGRWTKATATTLYAKWTPINYTVTWSVNGTATTALSPKPAQTGSSNADYGTKVNTLTLPTGTFMDDYVCGDKSFVGWTTATPYNSSNPLFKTAAEAGNDLAITGNTTFYAVFANVDEGTWTLDYSEETDLSNSTDWGSYGTALDYTASDGGEWTVKAYKNAGMQINTGKNASIKIPDCSGNITSIEITCSAAKAVGFSASDYSGSGTITYVVEGTDATSQTLDFTGKTVTGGYIVPKGGSTSITKIVVNYGSTTNHSTTCSACENVTVAYTAAPTGGTVGVKRGSTNVVANGTVSVCGSTVDLTVTITPASHYSLTGFTATGLTTGSATITPSVASTLPVTAAQAFTVQLSDDATGTLTLTPTFTAETPLTITLSVPSGMGSYTPIGTIYSGDDFDFPTVTGYDDECVDFIGWVDATSGSTFPNDGTATSEPSGLKKEGDNSGTLTTNKTYKAVYGERETSEADAYQKVTSAPADWSGDYLIVYEGDATHDAKAFDGSLTTLDANNDCFAVTITANVISGDYSTKQFTIAKIGSTSTYTIKSASGYYIGRGSSDTGNGLSSSTSTEYANTISYSSGTTITSAASTYLKFNYASGTERFRFYGSGQQDIALYKYGKAEVVTYTYTTAPSCGEKYHANKENTTGGVTTVSPSYAAEATTISIVATPNTGYTFTSWKITKDGTNPLQDVTSTLLTGSKPTTASTSFEMPAYDVTVTAAYSITNYTITYNNLNGASNSNPTSYTVATADINLADPGERSGYVFKGWYDAASGGNQVTTIANGSTGNVTLWARWAVGYTITWQNGVGSTNPSPTGVEDGNQIGTLPVPTGSCELNGVLYSNFVGWYTGTISDVADDPSDAGTLITSATVPTGNVTYHAVYTNMPDYSDVHTTNVQTPANAPDGTEYVYVKVDDSDDAPTYTGLKMGTSKAVSKSLSFTVPAGTTKVTVHGAGWSGSNNAAGLTLFTTVSGITITPNTAQNIVTNSNITGTFSTVTLINHSTVTFTLSGVNSASEVKLTNSNYRVVVWGINASSASGSDVGYITQCCDNMLAAPATVTTPTRTSTAITLSWTAVANATGYRVSWNGGDYEDVSTATTYAKTSLDSGTDYAYKIIAKYASPYCGATPKEGVVSTKPVYSVTYAKGSGTGSCSATGTVPAAATYEAGQAVTVAANPFTLPGNTFTAWVVKDAADNTIAVSNGQFTMPESDVTITATWTAKQDKFYDRMHNGTDATHGGVADGEGKYYITREGCSYVMPMLTDDATGTDICHTDHYKLLGWIASSNVNADGTVKESAIDSATGLVKDNLLYKPGVTVETADNHTYYAVWAKVE